MSILLEFEIRFKSDFHVGAGHGLSFEVDSALLRDPDGVPRISGTLLKGSLSESLMSLLALQPFHKEQRCQASGKVTGRAYCGQFEPDGPECPVCAIFGSPRHEGRWSISSVRPAGLMEPQDPHRSEWRAGETAAQTAARVRINPRTRRAEEMKLFAREEGDSSVAYRFRAICSSDDESAWREAELLVASARLLRNLGAGKRRGSGECEIHLVDRKQEDAILDSLSARLHGQAPKIPTGQDHAKVERLMLPPDPHQHTWRIRVLLRTDEPLLIARRAEAGNQFETLESIPGSVLRGALAWRVARRAGRALDEEHSVEYQNFVNLFFRGAIRFSPLMPVLVSSKNRQQGYTAMPAPRDLATCELNPGYESGERGHGVWSRAWSSDVPEECPSCSKPDEAHGTVGAKVDLAAVSGFLPLNPAGLTTQYAPRQTVEMHIRIQPETGRVRTGDLFGYVSIEPGQYFVGEITCADKQVWQVLQQMADLQPVGSTERLRLGRASRRGHGRVSLLLEEADQPPWHGPAMEERITDVNQVALTLLSDTIVVDPWGRFLRGFDAGWIKRELALPQDALVMVDETRAFSVTRLVDSFNAKLGLPRSREVALVAGSGVFLSFSGIELSELRAHLARAERRGIGLRRDEGFGYAAFNHPIYQELKGWHEPALNLERIQLGQEFERYDYALVDRFRHDWEQKLNGVLKPGTLADGRFEAVARLLYVSQAKPKDEIKALLDSMGKQEELLADPLPLRDKVNYYKGDGREGVQQIVKCLDELEKLIIQKNTAPEMALRLWNTGVQMLADRIAMPARQKAEEGRER